MMKRNNEKLTLVEHLNELRTRIIITLISVMVTSMAVFPFSSSILDWLKKPAGFALGKLAFFSPTEVIFSYMKISFYFGVLLSWPIIIFEIMAFVGPAFSPKVKKYIWKLIILSTIFFLIGVAFAYFVFLPIALKILLNFGGESLVPVISVSKYISFVIILAISLGLMLQMPIIIWFLTKIGLVNAKLLQGKRKYGIVLIFILAALVTPTVDIINMLLLAFPMLLLYEISIWVSRLTKQG